LAAFTGDLDRYRHALNRRVIYTPGVRYLAEAGGAYWLIDVIASWIGSSDFNKAVAADERIAHLHHWSLEVTGDAGTVTAWIEDAEPPFAPKPFITQAIPFTDFPLPEAHLWCGFDGEYWTLFLPSEY
jgi:3-hydroxy-3-methylglutaryl CoA synthase